MCMSKISEGLRLLGEGFIELSQLMEAVTPSIPAVVSAAAVPNPEPVKDEPKPVEKKEPAKKKYVETERKGVIYQQEEPKPVEEPADTPEVGANDDLIGMDITEMRSIAKELGKELLATKRDDVMKIIGSFGGASKAGEIKDDDFPTYVARLRALK
jgi:hypothetical protein